MDRTMNIKICFFNNIRRKDSFWNGFNYIPLCQQKPDVNIIISKKSAKEILKTRSDFHMTLDAIHPRLPDNAYLVENVDERLVDCMEQIVEEQNQDVMFYADITDAKPEQAFLLSSASLMFDMTVYKRDNRGEYDTINSLPQIARLDSSQCAVLRQYRESSFVTSEIQNMELGINSISTAQRICRSLSEFGFINEEDNRSHKRGNSEKKYTVNSTGILMERINKRIVDCKSRTIQK